MAQVLTVNIGELEEFRLGDKVSQTGIRKRPVEGRRQLSDHAVEGDHIGNPVSHGGPWQAVYAYAREDLDHWQGRLGHDVTNGMFGENLTTEGVDVTGARIGEVWQVGEAVLAVRDVRTPCWKWGVVMDDQTLLRQFREAHRPGAYLSIEQEGEVWPGAPIEVISRPDHAITCATVSEALLGDEAARRALAVLEPLSPKRRAWAAQSSSP